MTRAEAIALSMTSTTAIPWRASRQFVTLSATPLAADVECTICGAVLTVERDEDGMPDYPRNHVCAELGVRELVGAGG